MTLSNGMSSLTDCLAAPLVAQAGESFWLPPPDSSFARGVDAVFYFILGVATFFFLLIVALMVVFVVRYRRRPGVEHGEAPRQNLSLEITWSVIPLILVVIIFYWGFVVYMDIRLPPRDAYEIEVIARKWAWMFKYPNGHVDSDLYVPAGRPVRLVMRSEDIIHSLWIPDFRVKMDLVPGRYTKTWFRAIRPGQHALYCAEYCGTGHSGMTASVVVRRPGEFERWLQDAAKFAESLSPVERGELLYRRQGCSGCHSADGTAKTGPSFQRIFGKKHSFTNAPDAPVDENYLRESIMDPSAKVRQGYPDQMNSYKGQLTDEEIDELIAFIKSL